MSVWAVPISLTTTQGITIVFSSSRYLDVSVLWVCFPFGILSLQLSGLPHSEISGSKVVCTYPKLIAAYHVLHRLWEPRHPPYALINFLVELDVEYQHRLNYVFSFISICQRTCLIWKFLNLKIWKWIFKFKLVIPQINLRRITESNRMPSRFYTGCSANELIQLMFKNCFPVKPEKWRITDSNRWPSACKADALASWANSPGQIFLIKDQKKFAYWCASV